nr:MAG TPA: hypothetical protein [Caudoviricetes sp.]
MNSIECLITTIYIKVKKFQLYIINIERLDES